MAAITADGAHQFRVRFDALARRGIALLRRPERVRVDPYLIGRALAEVMAACTFRAASGRTLLWNEYRVILSRADFESLGVLSHAVERDLCTVLTREVAKRKADLVGELRVITVADDADELSPGHAVVRPAFVETRRAAHPAPGQTVLHTDERRAAPIAAPTFLVPDTDRRKAGCVLRWPDGTATLAMGATTIVGRAHPGSPAHFVALDGASTKINKQHLTITPSPHGATITRPDGANPVSVGGRALEPGGATETTLPVKIALSKGDLVLVLSRA